MRDWLPKFFGYMGCGVLIYDKLGNTLFSDPEFTMQSNEELDQLHKKDEEESDEEDLEIGLTNNISLSHKLITKKLAKTAE